MAKEAVIEELDLSNVDAELSPQTYIEETSDYSTEQVVVQEPLSTENIKKEIHFQLEETPFHLPLRIKTFYSEKDLDKFIKSTERLVRHSTEYKSWVQYIIEVKEKTTCALTGELISECSLEVHHHPISLYTLVKTLVSDFIAKERSFNSFDIATKTIELHYQNKVGYMLLLPDLHHKFHEGFQDLPIELVNGDYRYLLNNYNVEESDRERILSLCNIHSEDIVLAWSKNNYPGIQDSADKNKG